MTQKNSNKKNLMEPTCTQSEESGKYRKLLNNSDSSNEEEKVEKVKNFDWVPLKHGPFYAVGMQGQGYTLVLAGQAVSSEKYKTIAAAQKAVDEKGWDLIFIATAVYRDAWEAQNKQKKN
nr:MAG TPA: hypothetical protein [Microviridae sp.]